MFTLKGNVIQTTKYAVIWPQNVHFVKTLPVPLLKKIIYMFGSKFGQRELYAPLRADKI